MTTLTFSPTDFLLAVRAAQSDPEAFLVGQELPSLPLLEEVVSRLSPLPEDGIFLGLASDGLPLMLNIFNPAPGSIMILGDAGAGKTGFLKVVARALSISHRPCIADYAVITPHPADWDGWIDQSNCKGIWQSSSRRVGDLLFDLAAKAERRGREDATILLIDDLSGLSALRREELETLYWLFRFGPQGRVWPLVTLNAAFSYDLPGWVTMFRTRIYGHVTDPSLQYKLTRQRETGFDTLLRGVQFSMREKDSWLRFWLPLVIDDNNRKFA